MQYQVSRNGQLYGPYTLEDIRKYVGTGNVLPTDLARSEEMPEWQTVAQILGMAASVPPAYAQPLSYPATGIPYPDPPNLHWGLLLLFCILTCGIFSIVYDLIQVLWIKKVQPGTRALMYYLIFLSFWVLSFFVSATRMASMLAGVRPGPFTPIGLLSLFISLGILVFLIVYRFSMRDSLEQHFNGPEPIGLRLGPIMTFFFGGLYFQYHFNRIHQIKQSLRYRNLPL